MSESNRSASPRKGTHEKPAKPHKDFPLFPHASGRWAKKVKGKLHYFGPWKDADAALERWLEQKDDLLAGRKPRPRTDGLSMVELCNRFLTTKKRKRDAGQITNRSFDDYKATCDRIISVFGQTRLVEDLRPEDFGRLRANIAKNGGLAWLGNEINRCRMVFKYAEKNGLINRLVVFGEDFQRPSKSVMRRHRQQTEQANGKRMYHASEIRHLIDAAPIHLRAMILLGINCGFGNADCGSLPISAIDLQSGWIDFSRPKTGIERRCFLWPETVEAIRRSLEKRPVPRDEQTAGLVFVTQSGGPWHTDSPGSAISQEFGKLVKKIDNEAADRAAKNGKDAPKKLFRKGVGFYGLRHTFETIGGESRDQVAVNHIMGHADNSMAGVYRELISDERLRAVTDYVRRWLFGEEKKSGGKPGYEQDTTS